MGRRGPSPKPTALRVLQGNPGRLPLNPQEPRPTPAPLDLEPPDWLEAVGRAVWDRLSPNLRSVGLLTTADLDLFAAYCQQHDRWRAAEDFIKKNGSVYVLREPSTIGPKGEVILGAIKYLQQYPQVGQAQKALLMICKLGGELGLSPASRTRIHVEPDRRSRSSEDAKRIFGT